MNGKATARILAIASLIFPALSAAFPADSLVLVQATSVSATNDTQWVRKYAYSRDDHGFWYENMSEYRRDTLSSQEFKTYDARGFAVAESSFSQSLAGPVRFSVRTEYNAAGKPLHVTTVQNDSILIASDYQYDASGKLQKLTLSSADSAFSTFYVYAYDAQGRVLETKRSFRDSVRETTRYAYDGNGRESSSVIFGSKGDTIEVTGFTYDSAGRQARKVSRFPGDSLSLLYIDTRTTYAANGNMGTVKWYGSSGFLQHVDAYEYRSISIPLPIIAWRPRPGIRSFPGSGWDLLGRTRILRNAGPGIIPR